jgi:hypothetical protein
MIENRRGSEVIELARYRAKEPQSTPAQKEVERLLDEIVYHLLMAARAIKSHSKPKQ